MKIADVGLIQDNGGIWIARRNNKGNLNTTERINVTYEVLDMFCKLCESEEGKAMVYDKDGKAFEIHVHAMSPERLMEYRANKRKRGASAYATMMGAVGELYNNPNVAKAIRMGKEAGLIR